ncbi:uncharacterized protein LOC143579500 [Bidens hawaiensis]|uniref:uncharacterized protein LOC143579500 n=1 Tax=Bidens hawaiensis TaxID=980011 RepID=UPI00404A599D
MKTPYEIVYGHKPTAAHFRAVGFPCTLLNLEQTPKFEAKANDCYFVAYAGRTANRVYNKPSKQIVESYDVRWVEENETDARVGPDWLFDYDKLFKPFNLFPMSPILSVDPSESLDTTQLSSENLEEIVTETVSPQEPSTAEISPVEGENVIRHIFGSTLFPNAIPNEYVASTSYSHSTAASGWRNPLSEAIEDPSNLPANCYVLDHSIPSRVQRDHSIDSIIGPLEAGVSTRSQTGTINNCLYSCFISQIEPKSINMALQEPRWVDAMHVELNQFEKLKVEGLDYTEVYILVARIEAIRIFLAYASYMGFTVYQMDVKTEFLYGEVKEEIYVDQPLGFVDSKNPSLVYKLDKALYGLHQAPQAWYATLTAHLLEQRIYMDDIIFGFTCTALCSEFEEVMKKRFEMSSLGEMTMFLGLQVRQSSTDILLHQGKYVEDMLAKFEFHDSKSAATPMAERPLSILTETRRSDVLSIDDRVFDVSYRQSP